MSTLKNRSATIMTDIGLTSNFELRSGVIQGDLSAPNVFKLSENPLIIKLNIVQTISIPPQIPFKLNDFQPKPDSSPAFADDLNNFSSPTPEALQACTDILNAFGRLTNLKINPTKTKIMVSGGLPTLDFLRKVRELGYSINHEIKILGLSINNKASNLEINWNDILTKVQKLSNFWNLFHLSITGRINIVKTYFLAQLSHLGGILEPSNHFITEFTNIIVSFLKQGGKISKSRIFEPIEKGGLGLPLPSIFLQSLKVNIFRKGIKSFDTWGLELKNFCNIPGVHHSINHSDINAQLNPVLKIISKYYIDFCENYWKTEGNIQDSPILGNSLFLSNGHLIGQGFFSPHSWLHYHRQLISLKLKDFFVNQRVINLNLFRINHNCFLSTDEFTRLIHCIRPVFTKLKNRFLLKSTPIEVFLSRPKLRSKQFRPFFQTNPFKLQNCRPSITRYSWASEIFDLKRECRWISVWNFFFIPMNFREFAFKLVNNGLLFNSNLSHFDNLNIDPACTPCSIAKSLPAPKENYCHFFLFCNINFIITNDYFSAFLRHSNITWDQNFFFLGAPSNLSYWCSMIINIEVLLVSYFLFQCKIEKRVPLKSNLEYFTKSNRNIFLLSNKYKQAWNKWIGVLID